MFLYVSCVCVSVERWHWLNDRHHHRHHKVTVHQIKTCNRRREKSQRKKNIFNMIIKMIILLFYVYMLNFSWNLQNRFILWIFNLMCVLVLKLFQFFFCLYRENVIQKLFFFEHWNLIKLSEYCWMAWVFKRDWIKASEGMNPIQQYSFSPSLQYFSLYLSQSIITWVNLVS